MTTWQALLAIYAVGAPLVTLHMAWIFRDAHQHDDKRSARIAELLANLRWETGTGHVAFAAMLGLAWPLILTGYVLAAFSRKAKP